MRRSRPPAPRRPPTSPPGSPSRKRPKPRAAEPPPAERFALPAELRAVEHELEPPAEPWPARSLVFKAWPEALNGERDVMLCEILRERGWRDGGGPCDPDHLEELPLVLSGQHPTRALPRRALWIAGDGGEARALLEAFGTDGRSAARFRVSGLPGTSAACFKTYTARAMAAQPFAPRTFVLPAQRAALLAADEHVGYWVGKPKCSYAGRGIVVAADAAEVADGRGVVQAYVERPLLIGGYKSHLRVYMLVTSLAPLRAYVHRETAVMFATLPYSLSPSTLGGAFEPRVHLTNYDINARPSNAAAYLQDKPAVGRGCIWDTARLEAWLAAHRADIDLGAVWRQIRLIGRAVARSIAAHPGVAKQLRALPFAQEVGYELFGIDVMLDADGKVWLLECNDSPGLEYCGSHFADGTPSPDAAEGDAATRAVIHDTLALLGMDGFEEAEPRRGYLRVC